MSTVPTMIILAGGSSSRMWPLQEKLFLRFGDDPLLVQQLKTYQAVGFEKIVIVGNPTNISALREIVTQMPDLAISVVVQEAPIGMGNALLQARPKVSGDEAIYITQVHDLVDKSFHANMISAYQTEPNQTYLAGYTVQEYFPGGYLMVEDNQTITGIIEKPGAGNEPSNLVNIVAHIHANAGELYTAIENEYANKLATDDHYERAMAHLMKERVYKVVPYQGYWGALKYPWHVLEVMDFFLSQIKGQQVAESAFIADTATLVGDVYIGEGAKVFPGATIAGPAYVGKGTIVGNNALIRNSMVLDHCEVGYTTEVARSYVAENCSMHACRVLDSIFASGVNFSAGCTTANLRMDKGIVKTTIKGERMLTGRDKFGAVIGKDSFLSVDVMTMPGVKVGENAQVGPGTHVHRDVQDGQKVYVRQEQIVME